MFDFFSNIERQMNSIQNFEIFQIENLPKEICLEIIKCMIIEDFRVISKLPLVCKSFRDSIRKLLDSKEFRILMIDKFIPKEFQTPIIFPKLFRNKFDGTISVKNFKRLFNYFFHQKDKKGYAQYHKCDAKNPDNYLCPRYKNRPINLGEDRYTVDFSKSSLKYFPDAFEEKSDGPNICDRVYRLDISNNHLTSIPKNIENFVNLQSLKLPNNHLTVLPPEIGKLCRLRSLDLVNNQLTELLPEIQNLPKLSMLILAGNRIRSLPKLASIKYLNLCGNEIEDLSNFPIASFVELKYLHLDNNKLTEFPNDVIKLSLKTLLIDHNKIKYISPEAVAKLRKLTRFACDPILHELFYVDQKSEKEEEFSED